MRVCVDGRSLVGGPGRGVGQSTAALLEAMAASFPATSFDVVVPGGRRSSQLRFGAAALTGRPRLGVGADVVLLPAPAPVAVGVPSVLWVHDRSWEHRPGDFTAYERLWHRLARPRALARSAARVLTTTSVLREDLIAAWGLEAARVAVAAPGVRSLGSLVARPREHLLFVGALEPRKGPDVLERALALARARGLRAPLVAVGEGRLGLAGAWHRGRVDDAALAELLDGALALVVPSRLEGFGLPAVEALSRGCPVVTSDLPEVREALGPGNAVYVPPGDAGALADALLAVEAEPPVVAGDALARLTWDATARVVHAALVEAAGA